MLQEHRGGCLTDPRMVSEKWQEPNSEGFIGVGREKAGRKALVTERIMQKNVQKSRQETVGS